MRNGAGTLICGSAAAFVHRKNRPVTQRLQFRLHRFLVRSAWPRLVPHSAELLPTRCKEPRLVPAMALVEGLASTFSWRL